MGVCELEASPADSEPPASIWSRRSRSSLAGLATFAIAASSAFVAASMRRVIAFAELMARFNSAGLSDFTFTASDLSKSSGPWPSS